MKAKFNCYYLIFVVAIAIIVGMKRFTLILKIHFDNALHDFGGRDNLPFIAKFVINLAFSFLFSILLASANDPPETYYHIYVSVDTNLNFTCFNKKLVLNLNPMSPFHPISRSSDPKK